MSYGEGDLHARVGELERELSEAQDVVEDFACENVELRERVEELESLVRDMWLTWKRLDLEGEGPNRFHNGWKTFLGRMAALGIAEGEESWASG